MDTLENSVMPLEVVADNQAIIEHLMGVRPLDPEVARRIHERAEKATAALRSQYGTMNIAVDLIRAIRDEE